jgi:hypothetical protein
MRRLVRTLGSFVVFVGLFVTVIPASADLTANLIVGGDFTSGSFTGVNSLISLSSGVWYTSQTGTTNTWQISSLSAMTMRTGSLIQSVDAPTVYEGPVEFKFSYNVPNTNGTAALYGSNTQPIYGSYGTQIGTTINLTDTIGWTGVTETFGGTSFSGYDWYTVIFYGEGTSTDRVYIDNVSLKVTSTPVPLPAAFWLLGSGFIGLIGIRRFRK